MSEETRITRSIEFIAEVNPPTLSENGTGKLEIVVDEKTRYRVNYKLNNQAATEQLQENIIYLQDEFRTLLKVTLGIFGHRLILKTIGQMGDEDPVIELIEREQHIPELIFPDVHDNPTLSREPVTALLPRLVSSVPKMLKYVTLLIELYGLRTEPDFSDFRKGYDFLLPRVKLAQKAAQKYIHQDEKDWVRKICNDFEEYAFGCEDLIMRLPGDNRFIPEELSAILSNTHADPFKPQHIALEMSARSCGCEQYQYAIERLEDFRAGTFPESGKTRKPKHGDPLTRQEMLFLLSRYLAG